MRLAVRVTRSFARDGRLEDRTRICNFPIAPAPGMLVMFPDGAEAVVARVLAQLRSRRLPVDVEVLMVTEPGDRLESALKAGWAPVEPYK
jgi:hypothetical protein